MIQIQNLQKTYGTTTALSGIDLNVPEGELFAYLGPNGAGKTTTIRILTGLTKLSQGSASLNGHDIQHRPMDAKRQCGLVPQHINLDSELTVKENLDIHGRLFGMPASNRKERIETLLAYIELSDRSDSLVKQLSGGMKRRVMVARALLHDPRILFLDEPTVGLDANIRRRIWSLIKKIQKKRNDNFSHHPLHRRGRIFGRPGCIPGQRPDRGRGHSHDLDGPGRPLGHRLGDGGGNGIGLFFQQGGGPGIGCRR